MPSQTEILDYLKDVGFASREEIAEHFGITPCIDARGRPVMPGSINDRIRKLKKNEDIIAFDNGNRFIFVPNPKRH